MAGLARYLVLPSLAEGLGSWPRLSGLNTVWFAAALGAESGSFACSFSLQRLALQGRGWFAIVTAGLACNAVTDTVPGSLLILAGVHAGNAVLATLAYRIASYWLPLLAGPGAYLLYRRRYGRPALRGRP